ncbi:MAG: type II toxin-antitoxin system ParD family antitoxin [Microcystis novacekii Mn_MB_F_20050700_S1]|jgi:antitoxin ParD1/3/4|uniref:Type II toxin-antitoxin system ParD family antitoxin n=1 Tax=Microcystis novacekii Mn_MB_F_20050700_S1D TaxID=2486266 RepID=A0A552IKZ7_9CHRO|nr:MAG: type II toxin-antitoxin system ParD family antitoxin [Microcystis novacekii Mn_MB_F_20050700_S1D]TRU90433.1 MAG: type II toxin-antitoxin system ParD family antitoxin [Microcystis novacekii Mn_MB_F_20050700_S1]
MNITLNSEQEQFIQSQIAKGKYLNIQQVIDSALKLLEKQDQSYEQWLDKTRQKVKIGLEQLERGEKVDGEIVIAQLESKFQRMREENFHEQI